MNFLRKLKARKGFTLVECVVAIAIFALLVSVVFMIVANASNMSQVASSSEQQLNTLVQNVVADNSRIRYNDASSDFLGLQVSYSGNTEPLTLSYNRVSGYKTFIQCTNSSCSDNGPYLGDSAEFMSGYSKSEFDPSTMDYKCPKCGDTVALSLICDSCEETDMSKFVYTPGNGGYSCTSCGGGYVHDVNVDTTADASIDAMAINGITPNAIRYGDINAFTNPENILANVNPGEYRIQVNYEKNPTSGVHGVSFSSNDKYTVTLSRLGDTDAIGTGTLYLPESYVASIIKSPTTEDISLTFNQGESDDLDAGGNRRHCNYLTFNTTLSSVTFSFTLNNSVSNTSFDEDYKNDADCQSLSAGGCCLSKKWFQFDGNTWGPITKN